MKLPLRFVDNGVRTSAHRSMVALVRGNLGLSEPYSVHCTTAGHCGNAITALGVTQDFPSSISQVEMYDICIAFPTESQQLKAQKAKKPSLM